MPKVKFSREDMARTVPWTNGWYLAQLKTTSEEPASTDQSTNLLLKWQILEGEKEGLHITSRFNEKALSFTEQLVKIMGADVVEESDSDDEIHPFTFIKSNQGFKCQIHVNNKTYQGRLIPEVDAYRAA